MRNLTLVCLLFFFFCNQQENDLQVTSTAASLFDQPSPAGKLVAHADLNEGLMDLGRVSRFETTFEAGGPENAMPWIEVQNRQGQKGWMWMGWVKPLSGDSPAWLQQKRMLCYLGPEVYRQYQNWQKLKDTMSLAENFRFAQKTRDSMAFALHHRPDAGKITIVENWTWLTEAMPGFVFQRIDRGSKPYLFVDYRYWLEKASTTLSTSDDAFFQTMCLIYPADSIESFYPVWTLQTDENAGCSQLGLGRHDAMLKQLDEAFATCPEFRPELEKVKTLLLEDIFGKTVCYWQNEKKILTELNLILGNNYSCLTPRDIIALKSRKSMFESPAANGIRVNLRAGE